MPTARLSNNGYLLIGKEITAGAAVVPTIGIPLYDESISTNGNFADISPAYGNKFATHSTLPGIRSHSGDMTVMFEMNTAAHLFNAFLTKGTTTGTDPYTHPFTLGADSASYTYDISLGNIVKRLSGAKIAAISPDWQDNEGRGKVTVSALNSFDGREIASQSGAGPYTIVLKDPNGIFDGTPTKGLLVGDLIRFFKVSTGAVVDATVASIVNGTSFTTTTNPTGIVGGDAVHLRPANPTFNNMQPILWSKTRFGFGTTAAAALSATHTPLESGSGWEIMHDFAEDEGSKRSGSHDPASLDRTTGNISFTVKKLTDTPEDLNLFKSLDKTACVIRHYAGLTNQYELRVTLNQLVTDAPLGNIKSGELVFSELNMHTNYNQVDGQAFDVKVLNALATV